MLSGFLEFELSQHQMIIIYFFLTLFTHYQADKWMKMRGIALEKNEKRKPRKYWLDTETFTPRRRIEPRSPA